jgi:hypothetical protein
LVFGSGAILTLIRCSLVTAASCTEVPSPKSNVASGPVADIAHFAAPATSKRPMAHSQNRERRRNMGA